MSLTRKEAVDTLLKSYQSYFDITRFNGEQIPITARCDFFEHSTKYVLHEKAQLWETKSEEFLYLFDMEQLTKEEFEKCYAYALKDGQERMHIGPGHMYSFITAIFICDTCTDEAAKMLKKCRYYKSFHFSLHGWVDYHNAVYCCDNEKIMSNSSGKSTAKILKKVLFHNKKKRRGNK